MNRKLYYGWIMTAVAFIFIGLGTYFTIMNFGLFVAPVVSDLGVSVTSFVFSATVFQFVTAIGASFVGKIVDKKGIRFSALLGTAILAIGYVILGTAKIMPIFYLGYGFLGLAAAITGPLLTSAIAARWFVKYRGLVNGIISAGSGFIAMFAAPIVAKSIIGRGYSTTYFLCLIPVIVMLMLAIIFIKNKPEDIGQFPDGVKSIIEKDNQVKVEMPGLTLSEAIKTSGFWIVTIGFAVYMFADLSMFQTYNANIQSRGFDPILAAGVVSVFGLSQIPAKIIFGFLTDKISIKIATLFGLACLVAAALLTTTFTSSTSVSVLYLFAVLFSFGHGCWPPLFMKYIIYTCGAKQIGAVYGFGFMVFNLVAMFGPTVTGVMFDVMGTYNGAYSIHAICVVVAFVLLMFAKKGEFDH
ncbi:MFS transporter [Alkalibacter mobilis]|uniref:MFS transporter n=1 Tax=Alkalibacter mobilis TaxID=2787712 RepID=UPI00189F5632|nr:MFS transporter [Alkalibacter mobilis]MBF7097674.1 MFS transporter [Alkalibacter mobilis]